MNNIVRLFLYYYISIKTYLSLTFAGGEQGGDRKGGVGQGAGEPQQQPRRAD